MLAAFIVIPIWICICSAIALTLIEAMTGV